MSTSDAGRSGGPVTLDQLIALNDEMAALVRAGVPLERGLVLAGEDLRGRLGAIARDLGGRLGEGDRLPEALSKSGYVMPDLYRAIVEAGLRSGRLASALEGMATIARGHAEARRAVGLALLYPMIVVGLAYGLALGFVVLVAPRFVAAFESLELRPSTLMVGLAKAGETAAYWGPVVPALLVMLAILWVRSGRSSALDSGPLGRWSGRLPLIGPMAANFRNAQFAGLLALLVEHRVPLDESIRLAAGASGDRTLRRSAAEFAEGVRRGDPPGPGPASVAGTLPPLLSWMVTTGHRQGDLAPALRHAATTYRRKAEARAEVLRAALPTALMVAFGAGTVLLYGLLLFLPMIDLYDELALPKS